MRKGEDSSGGGNLGFRKNIGREWTYSQEHGGKGKKMARVNGNKSLRRS